MSVEIKYTEINLSENSRLIHYDKLAGKQGESYVRGVKFILPSEYSGWLVFVETQNAKGETNRSLIADFKDNVAIYKFSKQDLSAKGNLLLDLVLENGEMVYKPFSGEFAVKYAICAKSEYIDDDDDENNTSGIASEYIQVIKDNAKAKHIHDNKEMVLDQFGLNDAGDRPTFKDNDIAFQKDINDKLRDFDFTKIKESVLEEMPSPDWQQNNSEGSGFIENRTHYINKEPAKIWDNDGNTLRTYETLKSIVQSDQINTQNIVIRIFDSSRAEMFYEANLSLIKSITQNSGETYFYGNRNLDGVAGAVIYGSEHGDNKCPILLYRGDTNPEGWSFYMDESYLERPDYNGTYYVELCDANNEEIQYIPLDERFIPDTIARKNDIKSEVELALINAKESGVFDGSDGEKGDKGDHYELTEFDKNEIKEAVLAEIPEIDLVDYAKSEDIPTKISELENNLGYISDDELKTEVNHALEEAKASGVFDGKDGSDGHNGNDGLSAYQIWSNAGNTGTELDFLESLKGKNGADGKDGMSVTHEWNGTILTVISESGVSSADLKGETGNSGVYIGDGDMPEDCNVQINPNGSIVTISDIAEEAATLINNSLLNAIGTGVLK